MNGVKWVLPAVAVLLLGACAQGGSSNTTRISNAKMHRLLVRLCTQPSPFQCVDKPFTVTLTKRDGSTYSHTFEPPMPVIQRGAITIFSGQTLNIEAEVGPDGRLGHLKLVPRVVHADTTLVLQLEQSGSGMLLSVHNPFDRPLRYKAGIRPLGDKGFAATDVCPVMAKLGGIEMWPEPLFQVQLQDLQLLEGKNPDLTCR